MSSFLWCRNATEAMDLADSWLGVPKLLTPEEIVNPNVDEMSMMTYLSQFPNAKVTPLSLYSVLD
jgi:filamin